MTRPVVVDANIMVKWFIPEEYSREADALLDDHLDARVRVVAPSYALVEFTNALRKYAVRQIIDRETVEEALSMLLEMDIEFRGVDQGLVRDALRYALDKGVTVYDAYYIVLARAIGAVFYTADEKLLRRLAGGEPIARHIAWYVSR